VCLVGDDIVERGGRSAPPVNTIFLVAPFVDLVESAVQTDRRWPVFVVVESSGFVKISCV
jgi:hypothetical protein